MQLALPLASLRDEHDALDTSRLLPGMPWPNNVCPPTPVTFPLLAGRRVFEATEVREQEAARVIKTKSSLRIVWQIGNGWSPCRWAHPRVLCVYEAADDAADAEPLVTVEAAEGDTDTFFTLFQMGSLDGSFEHVRDWPSFWDPGDAASTWVCGEATKGSAHANCRCMPLVSISVSLEAVAPAGAAGRVGVVVSVSLEAGAFELDRRLAAGSAGGGWADEDEFQSALLGDRPNGSRDLQKALRRLLLGMARRPDESGLRLGPDSCLATMNRYAGVRESDVDLTHGAAGGSSGGSSDGGGGSSSSSSSGTGSAAAAAVASPPPPPTAAFDLGALLESISTRDAESSGLAPPLPAATLSGLRECTRLHPFQERGIAWMAHKEASPDRLSLHPAWLQLRTCAGPLVYLHTWTGELSARFFTAPRLETCGGMLCDDVGLGKSLQLLGLTLARPAPPGWAVETLPTRTAEVLPIKATLLVAPAALLPQWQAEVTKHLKEGALQGCVYLGLGAARKAAAATARAAGGGSSGGRVGGGEGVADAAVAADGGAEGAGRSRRSSRQRGRMEAGRAADGAADGVGADPVAADGACDDGSGGGVGIEYEVLARTQRHLFAPLSGMAGAPDATAADTPAAGAPAASPPVEECDLVLCSFETLRDELRKTQGLTAGMDLPLGMLPCGAPRNRDRTPPWRAGGFLTPASLPLPRRHPRLLAHHPRRGSAREPDNLSGGAHVL